jgi:hypothetical protein
VLQQRCSSAALVLQQCCSVLQQCCFSVAVVLQQCCSSVAAALQQGVLPRRSGLPRGSMHLSRARASSHAHPHLPHAGPTPIPCPCALPALSSLSMRLHPDAPCVHAGTCATCTAAAAAGSRVGVWCKASAYLAYLPNVRLHVRGP